MIEERKVFCMKPKAKQEKSFYVSIKITRQKQNFVLFKKNKFYMIMSIIFSVM